jgi:hypothetical protein
MSRKGKEPTAKLGTGRSECKGRKEALDKMLGVTNLCLRESTGAGGQSL